MTCTDSDTQLIHELQRRLRQAIDIISDRELELMALTAQLCEEEAKTQKAVRVMERVFDCRTEPDKWYYELVKVLEELTDQSHHRSAREERTLLKREEGK